MKGPFHSMGEKQLFMAYRDGNPVARVSAHRNFRHNEFYDTNQGFFGFFEAFEDEEAVSALFEEAGKWLKEKGCTSIIGPESFAIYDEIGILMDAYDQDPVLYCTYNPPYYPVLLDKIGFKKEIDWYAFLKDGHEPIPEIMVKLSKRIQKRSNVTFRMVNKKKWDTEVESIKEIFNQAWSENWGNVPFTDEQWQYIVKDLKLVLQEELAFIIEVDGKPVAFSVSMVDAYVAFKQARGRLFPFGIFKLLWTLKVKKNAIKRARTIILGVLKEYRGRGYEMVLIYNTIKNGLAIGLDDSDCSLIVETNKPMIEGVEAIGAKKYKTWRIFKKEI